MPLAPPGNSEGRESSDIEGAAPIYEYFHTPLPNALFFNHDEDAKHCKRDNEYIPDLLTNQRPSNG